MAIDVAERTLINRALRFLDEIEGVYEDPRDARAHSEAVKALKLILLTGNPADDERLDDAES